MLILLAVAKALLGIFCHSNLFKPFKPYHFCLHITLSSRH